MQSDDRLNRVRFHQHPSYVGGCAVCISGGCQSCGGDPQLLLDNVLQAVEDGKLSGGQVARTIIEYTGSGARGAGFLSSLLHGISKASSLLSFIPGVGPIAAPVVGTISGLAGDFAKKKGYGAPRRVVNKKKRRVVRKY